MNNKPIRLLGLFIVLILITSCSQPGSETVEKPEETETPEVMTVPETTEEPTASVENNKPAAETGLCANPYYPVREGSTWNYTSTSTLANNYSFTDTITSIRDNGFTLTTTFDNLTRTQEWACTADGLVAVQLGGGLNSPSATLKVETQEASGVTYPKNINAGDTWQHSLNFTGTMDIAGEPGAATGAAQSDFTAIGVESVTVPAGAFNAMKVRVLTTINIDVSFQGSTIPVTFSSTTTSWYAEGTGWVKSVSEGDFAGQSYTETIELQWYNLP